MSGTAVDVPYRVHPAPKNGSSFEIVVEALNVPALRGGVCNYIEVQHGPSRESRALFALPSIGQEGAISSVWRQFRLTRDVTPNWDGYGAAAPNEIALATSQSLLEDLTEDGLFPDFIQPSPEGGITVSFVRGSKHAAIEVHNDGDAVAVISRVEGLPEVWEFSPHGESKSEAISRIASYVLA